MVINFTALRGFQLDRAIGMSRCGCGTGLLVDTHVLDEL